MDQFIKRPLTLIATCLLLVACSDDKKGRNGSPVPNLQEVAKNIKHADDECPQNLNGDFCRTVDYYDEEGDHVSAECVEISLGKNSNGQLITASGEGSLEAIVDGRVRVTTMEGQKLSVLAYCTKGTLHKAATGGPNYVETISSISDDGMTLTQTSKGRVEGEEFNETLTYQKQ